MGSCHGLCHAKPGGIRISGPKHTSISDICITKFQFQGTATVYRPTPLAIHCFSRPVCCNRLRGCVIIQHHTAHGTRASRHGRRGTARDGETKRLQGCRPHPYVYCPAQSQVHPQSTVFGRNVTP
jgi:hypothetical protein